VAFGNVSDNFPDSKKADLYKYQVVVSYFKYAEMSYEEKQQERYAKVMVECDDFLERYNTSKYVADVNKYKTASSNYLNNTKK
jgi:outer membrane protein assembly factor BamD